MGYSSPAQFGIMTDLNETLAEVTLILVIIFILSAVDTIYHDFVFLFFGQHWIYNPGICLSVLQ